MVATVDCPAFCFDALISHFNSGPPVNSVRCVPSGQYPLFVTWKKQTSPSGETYSLRGCIGTFSPIELKDGLSRYALVSALNDSRFLPVSFEEIPLLHCGISVLTEFEGTSNFYDWEVGVHGISIAFRDPNTNNVRSATYLPEVCKEQGWNHQECLGALVRKAGYQGIVNEKFLQNISITRYQSSTASLTFSEYQSTLKSTDHR